SVYVFWWQGGAPEKLMMSRSQDGGVTFGLPTLVATLATMGNNGDLGLTGVVNGAVNPAPFRSNAFTQVVVNPVTGELYAVFNDDANGSDKSDIYLVTSINNGLTWSARVRIND